MNNASIKEELIHSNEDFQALVTEHQEYKDRLAAIQTKEFLTPEDEAEVKRIKLHKLALKDRMQLMMHTLEPG